MAQAVGKVTLINIKGRSWDVAHLAFKVGGEAFLLPLDADGEPQVHQMMASVLVGAFNAGHEVMVYYKPIAGASNRPSEIEVSSARRQKLNT
jgi:hypothetical protein